jgi:hypothetical protein
MAQSYPRALGYIDALVLTRTPGSTNCWIERDEELCAMSRSSELECGDRCSAVNTLS